MLAQFDANSVVVYREWIRRIEDITPFVRAQHARLCAGPGALETPAERVYPCPPRSTIDADPPPR